MKAYFLAALWVLGAGVVFVALSVAAGVLVEDAGLTFFTFVTGVWVLVFTPIFATFAHQSSKVGIAGGVLLVSLVLFIVGGFGFLIVL